MKWRVGQKVSYIYKPVSGKTKKYHGEIVNIKDDHIHIKWEEVGGSAEIYSPRSYILEHMELISGLTEDNPNRTFQQNRQGQL